MVLRAISKLFSRKAPLVVSRSIHASTFSACGNDAKEFNVLSFGDGSQGALGIPASLAGHAVDVYEPTPIPGLPGDIVGISAGHYHSLAVTSHGQLWAWGRDDESQLGRGSSSPREAWNEPKRVECLNGIKVISASASGVVSAAIGNDGSLWVWGRSKRGQLGLGDGVIESLSPSRVETLAGERIIKVSFGWGHALALSEDGKLFGWGYSADGRIGEIGGAIASSLESNDDGKLIPENMGKEKDMPIVWTPTMVEEFSDRNVIDIACGLDHSLILCGDGSMHSSGSNVYGQLGRKSKDIGLSPVDCKNVCVMSISAGLGHSFAIYEVDSRGEDAQTGVLSWGWNVRSQLGRGGPESYPLEVEGLAGENPVAVSGGRVHSICLTRKKEAWVWGCGKNGRLGLGDSADEGKPVLIDCLCGHDVVQAVAGFDHTMLLVPK